MNTAFNKSNYPSTQLNKLQPNGNGPENKPKHAKGLSWLFLILAVVGIVHISYIFSWEYIQFKDRMMNLATLEQSMDALRAESDLLADTIAHKSDLNYREQLARTEGFVYPEERLIMSPER